MENDIIEFQREPKGHFADDIYVDGEYWGTICVPCAMSLDEVFSHALRVYNKSNLGIYEKVTIKQSGKDGNGVEIESPLSAKEREAWKERWLQMLEEKEDEKKRRSGFYTRYNREGRKALAEKRKGKSNEE